VAEKKVYGPYKGSKQNGGRPIYVIRKSDGSTTSADKEARKDYEDRNGKLPKGTDVDHKDIQQEQRLPKSNLQAMKKGKNVAKENKRRAK
jgi:hypothetical protein